jgi:FtsZ-binding cell division protein ZapB
MQAKDFVQFSDLIAAAMAVQGGTLKAETAEYKAAVVEWDKRNNLSKELTAIQGQRDALAASTAQLEQQKAVFEDKVTKFTAKSAEAEKVYLDKQAELDNLIASAKVTSSTVEADKAAFEQYKAKTMKAIGEQEVALQAQSEDLSSRSVALSAQERKLRELQNTMAGALR